MHHIVWRYTSKGRQSFQPICTHTKSSVQHLRVNSYATELNQRKLLDEVALKLNFTNTNDWYSLSAKV